MLYGTPIDPKETQVLNTSVEDTKASSMRNALIVAYDANKAVNYSDCYALTENSLFMKPIRIAQTLCHSVYGPDMAVG